MNRTSFKLPAAFAVALVFSASILAVAGEGTVDVVNVHALPLGDGKISPSPRPGFVMSCTTEFHGGGAQRSGPWIHGDTWDLTEKLEVQGHITWPRAQFAIASDAGDRVVSRTITGNGLPVDTATGIFPVAYDDPAFQIDRNPNSISSQNIALKLPMEPQLAKAPSCVPMGMIGVALNGVAIFNGLDGGGRDAVAHEVQDVCGGHPEMQGQYHYHGPSPCLPDETQNEKLVGYALDGFGIYSMYDAHGRELTDADLDECHGRVSEVEWNGERRSIYHYVLTREYPYTIGCFRGTSVHVRGPGGRGGGMRRFMAGLFGFPPPPPGPPPGFAPPP